MPKIAVTMNPGMKVKSFDEGDTISSLLSRLNVTAERAVIVIGHNVHTYYEREFDVSIIPSEAKTIVLHRAMPLEKGED